MMDRGMDVPIALLWVYFVVQALGKANHQPPVVSELLTTIHDDANNDAVMIKCLFTLLTPASTTWGHGCDLLHQWNNRSLFLYVSFFLSYTHCC